MYYWKTELKRLCHALPGFFLSLAAAVLLCAVLFLAAEKLLPKAIFVNPFQVALCVEGQDRASDYVKEYVQQMESTGGLVEFTEMSREEALQGLENGTLSVCIVIPERTAESIMDGTNIPIQVIMGKGADNTQRYLEQRVIRLLTECGAALIDMPQAETLFLYELQVKEAKELGVTLDLFHFGLVMERESWFEKQEISSFGSASGEEYYLAAGLTLLLLFWGLGFGSYLKGQGEEQALYLKKRGIPLGLQEMTRQIVFFLPYLAAFLGVLLWKQDMKILPMLFLATLLAALQCYFLFSLMPVFSGGIFLNGIFAAAGFFGAGGVLPTVFLPEGLTAFCAKLPPGILLSVFLQISTGRNRMNGSLVLAGLLWCIFFMLGGQVLYHLRIGRRSRA